METSSVFWVSSGVSLTASSVVIEDLTPALRRPISLGSYQLAAYPSACRVRSSAGLRMPFLPP